MQNQSLRLQFTRGAVKVIGVQTVRFMETWSSLPGKKRMFEGSPFLEATDENLRFILDRHPTIQMCSYLQDKYGVSFDDNYDYVENADELYADLLRNYQFKKKPFKHQLKDTVRFVSEKFFALLYEMGCGKTKVTLDITGLRYQAGEIDTLLVFAPAGVHAQWVEEQLQEHLPSDIEHVAFKMNASDRNKGVDNFKAALRTTKLAIFALNIESLVSDVGRKTIEEILTRRKNIFVVMDESSRIKNPKAASSKYAHRVADKCKYKAILNGSPVTKGAEDLWSQFSFLSKSILGNNYYAYRNKYCVMGGWENKKVVGYRNMEELQSVLDRYSSRVRKEDCFDLPEKIFIERPFELTPEQDKYYTDLKTQFMTELDNGEVWTVARAAERYMRLQQILDGFIMVDGETKRIPTNKTAILEDILEQTDRKMVVWAKYYESLDIVSDLLRSKKIKFVEYSGRLNAKQKEEAKHAFKTDPDVRVIVANRSMDRGHNLTEGKISFWYTIPESLDSHDQSNDRFHRMGQDEEVYVIYAVTKDKVDRKALRTLQSRKDFATSLVDLREALCDY